MATAKRPVEQSGSKCSRVNPKSPAKRSRGKGSSRVNDETGGTEGTSVPTKKGPPRAGQTRGGAGSRRDSKDGKESLDLDRFAAQPEVKTEFDKTIAKILQKYECVPDYPVQVSSPTNACHTGLFQLDLILSGGFHSGRMYTHVAGPSQGKSTLIQEHLAAAQLQRMMIYYFEIEKSGEGSYMLRQGVKPPAEYRLPDGSRGFYYLVTKTGEEVYRLAIGFLKQLPVLDRDDLIHKPPRAIFLIDGYESMTSEGVTPDKNPIGSYARMHSRFQKLVHEYLRSTGSTWVATNQTRTAGIGSFYVNPEADAGGQALKFYADAKTFIRLKKAGADNYPTGVCPMTITTKKNKLCVPNQVIRERLYLGHGVDRLFDRLMFLVEIGVVKQDGKVFMVEGKKYNLARARKLMLEREWWKECRRLRRDPEVYKRYFASRTATPDW